MGELGLFQVVAWLREQGRDDAVQRVRLRVLPATLKEGVRWDHLDAGTMCSRAYLQAVREAASDVVGAPCPV